MVFSLSAVGGMAPIQMFDYPEPSGELLIRSTRACSDFVGLLTAPFEFDFFPPTYTENVE